MGFFGVFVFLWCLLGCVFCQQKEDMMEWPRDRLCNVTEIKNNEMIQSF